jgi:hypothetical protein
VAEPHAFDSGHPGQCTDLIRNQVLKLGRADAHLAPTEPLQILEARMRPDGHSMPAGQLDRGAHHHRISRVKTAGDVRGRDRGQHPLVVPDHLANVGIQVDRHGFALSDGGHPCNSSLIAVGPETGVLAGLGGFSNGMPVAY